MVGRKVKLEVKKMLSFGAILDQREILLPLQYMPKDCKIGDQVEVFIYTDSEDRIIATTLEPYAILDEIACLEVVSVSDFGVFLDLGIPKDLLMPCKDPKKYKKGQRVAIQISKDREGRLLAHQSLKFAKYRGKAYAELEALPYRETPLGFECIIEKKYQGMLFKNEIFKPIVLGEKYRVQVKRVREDGKVDLKLAQENEAEHLLKILELHGGKIKLSKESSPEEIIQMCQMSKKAFKRALNHLAQRVRQDGEFIFVERMEQSQ